VPGAAPGIAFEVITYDAMQPRVDRIVGSDDRAFLVAWLDAASSPHETVVEQADRQPFGEMQGEDELVEALAIADRRIALGEPRAYRVVVELLEVGAEEQARLSVAIRATVLVRLDEVDELHDRRIECSVGGMPARVKHPVQIR